MVLGTIIQQMDGDATEAGQAAFFGFMGIASALVFASTHFEIFAKINKFG